MHRYKFSRESVTRAIAFVRKQTKEGPAWAKKHVAQLTTKDGVLFFDKKRVVPREEGDALLRKEIYQKGGTTPSGRDACFHVLKQRYVGVSRRATMEFLRRQKALGARAAVPKAKQSYGERLKRYCFETDLVFLKKNDLIKKNKRFARDDSIPDLSYFVSSVEKCTGLCRLTHVKTKLPSVVTPICLRHFREMAADLNVKLKECDVQNDFGGEFDMKEFRKHVRQAKNVTVAPHVENLNRQIQKIYFDILKQRKAITIKDALEQTQNIKNATYNRVHKLSSNELVKRGDTAENLKEYNRSRKEYQKGDNRKPFTAGQYVRVQIKKEKGGDIGFKSYHDKTFTERVFLINRVTKKAVPEKYYVNGKWYLQSSLLLSAPRDETSQELVDERTKSQQKTDRKGRTDFVQERFAALKPKPKPKPKPTPAKPKPKTEDKPKPEPKPDKPKPKTEDKPPPRRSKRFLGTRTAMLRSQYKSQKIDDYIEDLEEKEDTVHKKHLKAAALQEKKEFIAKQAQKKGAPRDLSKEQRKTLKKYLKRHGLPRGGTTRDLLLRVQIHRKQSKKKKVLTV